MKIRKIPKIASIIPVMRRSKSSGRETPMKARIIQRTPNITPITGYIIDLIAPNTGSSDDVLLLLGAGVFGAAVRNPGGQLQPSVVQTEFEPVELLPQSKFCRELPLVLSKLVIQTELGEFGQSSLSIPSKSFGLFVSNVPEQQKLTA